MLRCWTTAALLCLAGCATGAASGLSSPADSRHALHALIGEAACRADSECRTIGWGAKPCGGPQRYVAWSTARTDGTALQQLADLEAERQRGEQQRRGIASNCALVPDPGARCNAGRCVLRERGNGGAQ